jgi:16S rRNA (guanine(1405)-N(7))-methyltransferase
MTKEEDVESIVAAIKQSKKYRDTNEETIRELAVVALSRHKKAKDATKAVRKRLHSIMAPYLGDPDYEAAAAALTAAFAAGDTALIKQICHDALYSHLSTRERLPIMAEFYRQIFQITGAPGRLLDIACGLNPLSWPWMGLPDVIEYIAYDIHEPRISFINSYFQLQGLPQLARMQDVALHFPQEKADVALFLKEMPRFERNYPGTGRNLLEALQVKYLVISFPSISTHGGRNLSGRYRQFFNELTDGFNWQISELLFRGELVFIAEKPFEAPLQKGKI